jgi:uncharacterized protein with PIN domain
MPMLKENCPICNSKAEQKFTASVLGKYDAPFMYCPGCHFLFARDPHWLKEAYERPINIVDTGLVDRNITFARILSVLIFYFFKKDGKFLDYAGGYGLLTRLMRDIGFDFYWHDPYTQNLFANGFEYEPEKHEEFDVVTAFEVFEHLENLSDIDKMKAVSTNIIFSTELLPSPVPMPSDWWYYGFEHGQHIAFYSKQALVNIAKKLEMNFYTTNTLHLFTEKKISEKKLMLYKKMSRILFPLLKNKMNSRTWQDYLYLKYLE